MQFLYGKIVYAPVCFSVVLILYTSNRENPVFSLFSRYFGGFCNMYAWSADESVAILTSLKSRRGAFRSVCQGVCSGIVLLLQDDEVDHTQRLQRGKRVGCKIY